MDSFTSMKSKLLPLGLYSLENDSVVCSELRAYSEGLDSLFEDIDILLRESFLQTAESYGIEEREKQIGRPRPDLTTAQRRARLTALESNAISACTPANLLAYIRALGLSDVSLAEVPSHSHLTVHVRDALTDGEKSSVKEKILSAAPAGIVTSVSFDNA